MKQAILYIHGKGGNAAEAERFKPLCPRCAVYGLDYKGQTPWETKGEILNAYKRLASEAASVTILANSIGAFFSMHALQGEPIERALFISPIVNMEKLICDMMRWAGVNEAELEAQGEISTDFGETLSHAYLQYVRAHPIAWSVPTEVLYAGRDALTDRETVEAFCEAANASLTVMEDGEHWFHTEEQLAFLDGWLKMVLQG